MHGHELRSEALAQALQHSGLSPSVKSATEVVADAGVFLDFLAGRDAES